MGFSELRARHAELDALGRLGQPCMPAIGSTRYIDAEELDDLIWLLESGQELPESAGCPDGHSLCDGECSEAIERRRLAAAGHYERRLAELRRA